MCEPKNNFRFVTLANLFLIVALPRMGRLVIFRLFHLAFTTRNDTTMIDYSANQSWVFLFNSSIVHDTGINHLNQHSCSEPQSRHNLFLLNPSKRSMRLNPRFSHPAARALISFNAGVYFSRNRPWAYSCNFADEQRFRFLSQTHDSCYRTPHH